MKVILDANMLMSAEQFNINLFSELDRVVEGSYDPVVPEAVIGELERLKEAGKRSEGEASVALQLAERCRVIQTSSQGDESILELAKKFDSVVATNDSELIKRLKSNNIPVIYMRQKTHLVKNSSGVR